MSRRARLLALALLTSIVAASSALAGRSDTSFTVTSTLDGKAVLPIRSQWIATPQNAPSQGVAEVDYFIDGFHAWTEHQAPYYYGGNKGSVGNLLVTTFLKPGLHTFSVRAITPDNQVATDTVKAEVVAPPKPPAKFTGTWTLEKATNAQRPPLMAFTISSKGWTLGPNFRLDAQYLATGNIVLGTLIIDRPEQVDNVCSGQPPLHPWHTAFSADGKSMTLNPVGSDPCRNRLAALQGTWTRSH
jgi:hypothetical protein